MNAGLLFVRHDAPLWSSLDTLVQQSKKHRYNQRYHQKELLSVKYRRLRNFYTCILTKSTVSNYFNMSQLLHIMKFIQLKRQDQGEM